jgi:hypothetical protein
MSSEVVDTEKPRSITLEDKQEVCFKTPYGGYFGYIDGYPLSFAKKITFAHFTTELQPDKTSWKFKHHDGYYMVCKIIDDNVFQVTLSDDGTGYLLKGLDSYLAFRVDGRVHLLSREDQKHCKLILEPYQMISQPSPNLILKDKSLVCFRTIYGTYFGYINGLPVVMSLRGYECKFTVHYLEDGKYQFYNANTGVFMACSDVTLNVFTVTPESDGYYSLYDSKTYLCVPPTGRVLASPVKNIACSFEIQVLDEEP